ncbi:DUF3368 domain-containing protein [Halosimplex aquaticum]|uniref:DUF3368 domain-containing protein n=1 Tax=Halosimplex aquaticum TaxID=3026162 RepID=A0ABD5XTQ9_9EURY|nr:DUF3368 domain-containing protein [Halosimplex aquaticum]
MWVFDATPLIYLAKVDALDLADQHEERCLVPAPVYEEVVEAGVEAGYPDARRIEAAIDADTFDVVSVDETPLRSRLEGNPNLSDADSAVLACAARRGGIAVMDETAGRTAASVEEIPTRGTVYLVLSLVRHGVITADEARDVIDAMVEEGWYCSTDMYAKICSKLDSLAD